MEKKGKEVILLVLALVLVAITAFTLIPRKAKAPQAVAATESNTAQNQDKAVDAKADKKTADEDKKSDLPELNELLGGAGNSPNRNPFAAPAGAATSAATTATAKPQVQTTPAQNATASAAAAGTGELPPFFPQNPSGAMVAPPVEVLQFTGILQGNEPMAIVRRGESRYFVTVGEYVENYRVTFIGSDRLTLKSKEGKQIILHLGGGA